MNGAHSCGPVSHPGRVLDQIDFEAEGGCGPLQQSKGHLQRGSQDTPVRFPDSQFIPAPIPG